PDAAHVLVEQVLEFGTLALVAGRAHVRDVVRDHLNVEFLRHHAGGGGVKGSHDLISFSAASGGRNFGKFVDCRFAHVALVLQQAGDLRVGACDLDHARHLDDAAHV